MMTNFTALCLFTALGIAGAIRVQNAFFARSGVDEYLTRRGLKPSDFKALWTVPVDLMVRMGFGAVVELAR